MMSDYINRIVAAISFVFIGFILSCNEKISEDKSLNTLTKDDFLSKKFGKEIQLHGDLHYDDQKDIAYYSGYLKLDEAEETGNYVFDFKNGNVLNNYIDAKKSERSIQDGPSDKNFIIGIGREFGVRMYSEYDNEQLNFNQLAMIQIDTTNRSIQMHLQKNDAITSSIELKDNFILIKKGIPNYKSIEDAANDIQLPSGAIFKVFQSEKVSSLYIKN